MAPPTPPTSSDNITLMDLSPIGNVAETVLSAPLTETDELKMMGFNRKQRRKLANSQRKAGSPRRR